MLIYENIDGKRYTGYICDICGARHEPALGLDAADKAGWSYILSIGDICPECATRAHAPPKELKPPQPQETKPLPVQIVVSVSVYLTREGKSKN